MFGVYSVVKNEMKSMFRFIELCFYDVGRHNFSALIIAMLSLWQLLNLFMIASYNGLRFV